MKKFLFLFIFFSSALFIHAQKEASIWYFGRNAGVDFNSGTPVALTDGELYTEEGSATISDKNGNLLFYTDGVTVWNRNHTPMPNGTGLNGHSSSTQSALIVPKSDQPNIYYIFTVDHIEGSRELQYSIVDLNLDSGLGDITATKNMLLQNPVSEKIAAVENRNGNGIWVISKGWENNGFYAYLVDATGLNTTPVISNIGWTPMGSIQQGRGYLKASPDGSLLACAIYAEGVVELFHFDAGSGTVTDKISLKSFLEVNWYDTQPNGVEFSPNNKVLYVSTKGGVYQFDISSYDEATILASGLMVSPLNSGPPFLGGLQMGIDGKIYVPRAYRNYLNVVNDPNTLGLGCNYQEQAIDLGTDRLGVLGLPTFISSYFDFGIEAENFCLGSGTEFSIQSGEPIVSITWDFGDGNTSALEAPIHTYAIPGDYTASVTLNTLLNATTKTKEITIYKTPIANPVTNFISCYAEKTFEFDLSTKDTEILGTQSTADFKVYYYPTLGDAENKTKQLPTLYRNTLPTETIFARIQNSENPECYKVTDFDLIVAPTPVLNTVTDWVVCDSDGDGLYSFDLAEKNTEILNGQSASTFSITYYENKTDADTGSNPLGLNYTNTSASQEIFYKIGNISNEECYETGNFNIEVTTGVTANTPIKFEVCNTTDDGFSEFDLTKKDSEILGSQSASSFKVSYYATQIDADNGVNALDASSYANTKAYAQTLYARVENSLNSNCYDTANLELSIYSAPIQQAVLDWQICDINNDGTFIFDLTQKDTEILGNQSARDFKISYHLNENDAIVNQNKITTPFKNTTNPQAIYYRIENSANPACYLIKSFMLKVLDVPMANAPTSIFVCDINETGEQTFDLSVKDSEVLNGQSKANFEINYFGSQSNAEANQNPLSKTAYIKSNSTETIYARIQNIELNTCYDITSFKISIHPLPKPSLEETYIICPDSPDLVIDGGEYDSWSWRDDTGVELDTTRNFNSIGLGKYTLTVTQEKNNLTCEKTVDFEVLSSGAPEDFTTTISDPSDKVGITVAAIGLGEFEYSIDETNYQDSNRFEVFPGEYTVYVRDKYLCRTISKEVIALGFQKFFTPNGDGVNEFWNIIGGDLYPESQLYIYDRYGKMLQQISPTANGWDGTSNGLPLPASDYWFRYVFNNGKVFTGHFSLKR
ncbi:T9SS type B sorting domain-containing protein [Zobellia laminariae]|uniref:T9SS type B sorting domain-containing protein n=1 Tax=Zobellia laminariae TaxID=248906 RepID=UPI0012D97DD9|nr:PKD domain-containing protein [Zobellia laminariae]